ncbi:P pilus assembly protein, pilin FimA [Serratia fonticola]|nr:P pilus assembly protein, pilin FimA [Serratia fonticola]
MLFRKQASTGHSGSQGAVRRTARRYGLCPVLCLALLPCVGLATPTLQMKAIIEQSACTVDVDQSNGDYTLTPTKASDIWGAPAYIQPALMKITLTLSNCGVGDAQKTPAVTVSGPKPQAGEIKKPGNNTFRDTGPAGGDAKEFFIGIAKTNSPKIWPTDFYSNLDTINFTPASASKVAMGQSGEGATADVWVGVASGKPDTDTDKAKARAGVVKATLTFTMAYQ